MATATILRPGRAPETFTLTPEQEQELQPQPMTQGELKTACESAIYAHIQAKVDAYNDDNGLSLTDVYRCEQYSRAPGYPHQAFCAAVWTWNVQVWETARAVMAQAMAGEITITSPADAMALLPPFEFEG